MNHPFGNWKESFLFAFLIILVMWLVQWAQFLFDYPFYQLGVKPRSVDGIAGIVLMPFIHAKSDFGHIINNSVPTFFMVSAIFYYYRQIAFKILLISWFSIGVLLWLLVIDRNAFHIGMSGMVYAMASFLFTSGTLRKYLPLQAISLFLVFVYGSMIWGIFPTKEHISWEGHLIGFIVGIILAYVYRNQGPVPYKYQYEIERDLGIEPPDFEGEWNRRLEELEAMKKAQAEQEMELKPKPQIVFHYVPKKGSGPQDGNDI